MLPKSRPTSGVSLAISKTIWQQKNKQPLISEANKKDFIVKIANTQQEREDVFRLGYQVYREKGYIKENENEWMIQNYDFNQDTIILTVLDHNKKLVGSVTLVFEGTTILPSNNLYKNELNALRKKGSKLAELSRLVVDRNHRNCKEVLVLMFNYLAIYIKDVKQYDGLVIQVNPRHVQYYKSLLSFEELGGEKACPIVQNAPAILLHLSIDRYNKEKSKHITQTDSHKERSLYPYFLKPEQEQLVASYLQNQARPMSQDEKIYFHYNAKPNNHEIAYKKFIF